ncbi:RNA polymerase sigma-70 factor [Mycobacteroides abscessus subsp. massiliense]|nr:RNA polymerase sigma-70 factor [Mycobacteroides abscessus subsp. massiliense]SKZ40215.1 RNA polymerase sigma-70 factor [Mycobacteroides abscessus subsp. massiliense]
MSAASPRNESAALPQNAAHRFERDVIPFTPTLFSHALRLTRHRPDAEDLLQDTLLRAYRCFNTFEPGTNLRAWLFRIQTNSFISGWQRRQRRGSEVNLCEEIQYRRYWYGFNIRVRASRIGRGTSAARYARSPHRLGDVELAAEFPHGPLLRRHSRFVCQRHRGFDQQSCRNSHVAATSRTPAPTRLP